MPRPRLPVTTHSPIMRDFYVLLDASGETQTQVAKRAGVSQSTISKGRHHKGYASVLHLEWILEAMGYELAIVPKGTRKFKSLAGKELP